MKSTQILQSKMQNHIRESMLEAHKCLKRASDVDNSLLAFLQNKKQTISQPFLSGIPDCGPKELTYANNLDHNKKFRKSNIK